MLLLKLLGVFNTNIFLASNKIEDRIRVVVGKKKMWEKCEQKKCWNLNVYTMGYNGLTLSRPRYLFFILFHLPSTVFFSYHCCCHCKTWKTKNSTAITWILINFLVYSLNFPQPIYIFINFFYNTSLIIYSSVKKNSF